MAGKFVLPEKWQVLRTEENHDIINNYFIKINHGKKGDPYDNTGYICLTDNYYKSRREPFEDCQIITFEQFQMYVLKEDVDFEEVHKENTDYLESFLKKLK